MKILSLLGELSKFPLKKDNTIAFTACTKYIKHRTYLSNVASRARPSALVDEIGIGLKLYGHEACVAWRNTLLAEHILPALRPSALDRLEWHRERGDELVLATATNEFLTQPVASHLEIPHLIASPAARRGTDFTGERGGPACFREEKLRYVESWLGARGHTLESVEAWFYSDSINDLPLLGAVHHPVVVAPDQKLAEIATANGWELIPS